MDLSALVFVSPTDDIDPAAVGTTAALAYSYDILVTRLYRPIPSAHRPKDYHDFIAACLVAIAPKVGSRIHGDCVIMSGP